jgi:acyl-coenzyme A synthetase/AMP-(fatty) acid ligase
MRRWQERLDAEGIRFGNVVGIRADYSLAAIAALLALLERRTLVALIPRDGRTAQYIADARVEYFVELNENDGATWRRIGDAASHPLLDRLRTEGDGGIILFTSGSSGPPKAALQGLERFLRKLDNPGRPYRTLAFLMFDHVGGLDIAFHTLAAGGALILTRRRDPTSIMRLIERHSVEALPASPSFLRLLCAAPDDGPHDLSSLKIISYSSEPMDPSTLSRINARFPDVRISQKYGTTETGSPRSVSRSRDSLWMKLSDEIEAKVVAGILWLRTDGAILGYLNAPSPIGNDGWYCTGDEVEVDGEWIRILGRKSDTINVGGEKVAPVEVEQSILELDFIRDAVVRGEPHALMGQIVSARVALSRAMSPKDATARIRSHCRDRLAPHKVPVKIEVTTDSFTNARQKAQRQPL